MSKSAKSTANVKPLIGINADFRPQRKDSPALSWLISGYYESIVACGGVPVVIPPLADKNDLEQVLQSLDGLVLSGCAMDLDPRRLGLDKHPSTRPMSAAREDFDRSLCSLAVEMRLPLLAIGGGMQTLNVICGGSVIQCISEEVPKSLHHFDPVETTLRHIIDIVPGTRVDSIYGPGEIRVNSQHHMAVSHVPTGFAVSATSADGVVESIESVDDDWFCVGVQWHPENDSSSALDMQVFEHFLEACRAPEPVILSLPRRMAA
ncbi:MAG: gamma-glutamyl-gamma-aminobutyrate hydrolase family protein [Planctomycetaceae bacterium]